MNKEGMMEFDHHYFETPREITDLRIVHQHRQHHRDDQTLGVS